MRIWWHLQFSFVNITLDFYHRWLTIANKHHKHNCCHCSTGHSCSSQSNAQCFIKGKKVQLTRDTGCFFSIGPELKWTTLTVKRTWEREEGREVRKEEKWNERKISLKQADSKVSITEFWNLGYLTIQCFLLLNLTSCIANLPFRTWNAVKAAERFSFPVGLSGTWGAALTAHWNRNLNINPINIHNSVILWVDRDIPFSRLTQLVDVTTWLDPVLHWIADSLRWRSNPSTRPIKTSLSDPSGVFCQLTRSYFAGMSAPWK